MRLTHLTLVGFKSFAKKTTIAIDRDVTGIVGPNGSGKSNIAEAIRFVLGEQSIKSMRGKVTTDLLYKGGSQLAPASRAAVSLTLDNRDKKESKADAGDLASFLVYDEIVLARTLYADGTSEYTINDAKVRLKDVQELLALAGIGSVQHLIISQGEADRLLLASPRDRKELLEDALGLRIFHIRLKESERKLERVKDHMREVDLLRKEISPQLNFLEKEVRKLEKIENEKQELARLFAMFSHFETKEIKTMEQKLDDHGEPRALTLILESLEKEIHKKESGTEVSNTPHEHTEHKSRIQATMRQVQTKRDQLSRTIGRLEAERAYLEKEDEKARNQSETITISNRSHVHNELVEKINACLSALDEGNSEKARELLSSLKDKVKEVLTVEKGDLSQGLNERLVSLVTELEKHEDEEKNLTRELVTLQDEFDRIEETLVEEQQKELADERHKRELVVRYGELKSKLREQEFLEQSLRTKKDALEMLTNECVILAGKALFQALYKEIEGETYDAYATRKSIERLKLRIEDAGLSNGDELKCEYETLSARDAYLQKELDDVVVSEQKLSSLIKELETHIKTQFAEGIKTVSLSFNAMFGEVFKGGTSSLALIEINKDEFEEGSEIETGIDIKVSLPEKRVRELSALSGGEKALTSIALSFAMSQIAPPPFMLLDETDAALDESNAKKYGVLLTKLSKNSALLVITHNRETMSHCDMLYGITIGADGASKLLSITFDKAENFAS